MTIHVLTAGDGYSYVWRHIATGDSTELGRAALTDYYSDKGESPGVWLGSGLPTLGAEHGIAEGDEVTAEQMKALFGEGLHPNADAIMADVIAHGGTKGAALQACRLGRAFNVKSGATAFRVAVAQRFDAHNKAVGAKWNAPIDAEVRARIRTDVAGEMFAKEYGRAPSDDRELSGFTAKLSRQNTKDVAGFDLAFTPPKSVSVLWALAPMDIARIIEDCHNEAVKDTIEWLEQTAAFSRIGTNGVGMVDTNGLLVAAFNHRDSRAGDPNLHTHGVVSNPVQVVMPTGQTRWLRLDSATLHKMVVPGSEYYNTRIMQRMLSRLPVDFAPRREGDRSPIMELVGADLELCDAFSSRDAMIQRRISELAREFQAKHGREPTPIESYDLAQRATLETRQAKHEPRSHAEQRAQWREFAEARGIDVEALVAGQLAVPVVEADPFGEAWLTTEADAVLSVLSKDSARWQWNHAAGEALRRVRAAKVPEAEHDRVLDGLLVAVEARSVCLEAPPLSAKGLEPGVMRRRDGRSIYQRALTDQWTSQAILDAEDRIVSAAGLAGGTVLSGSAVELALIESAANGRELNAGQSALVRSIAASDRRVALALAPAGTGKTATMQVLARAWNATPGHSVVGLAPTAKAGAVLREELNTVTDNVAKLNSLIALAGADAGVPMNVVERARKVAGASMVLPDWFRNIGPGTLVIVDEAGMVGTPDLDPALGFLLARGADVVMVADQKQLPSVNSGGVLTDIEREYGAVTLSHVMRFVDKAEGPASLALREGDEAALGFYADQGRIHCGEPGAVADMGYAAWAADVAAGKDSILLAYSRETVAELNARARTDRLADAAPDVEVDLADGLRASVGDTVLTRRNDRRLALNDHDWVRNGDRWTVEDVLPDGRLWVRHVQLRRPVILPAEYVREHVTLGYARTIHTSQGVTVGSQRSEGTGHTILTGAEVRELLYTALTRARNENHVYVPTALSGDMHDLVTAKGALPDAWLDVMRSILARSGAQVSARSTIRNLADPLQRLGVEAGVFDHAVGVAAEVIAGDAVMAGIDAGADLIVPGVTSAEGWPVLRGRLAVAAVEGGDPIAVLTEARDARELRSAQDVAAVLSWRIDRGGDGPLPWLDRVPQPLADDAVWGPFLRALHTDVAGLEAGVRARVAEWSAVSAPVWARPFVVDHPRLCADLAVWRAARGVPDTDRRPVGAPEKSVGLQRHQDALADRVGAVMVSPETVAAKWKRFVDSLDPRIAGDPFWLEFAANLDRLQRAGVDAEGKARAAFGVGPLPDELPAAALWWRMTRDLAPGAVEATGSTAWIRPDWADDLVSVLGDARAVRVMSDPAWPQLVAAVEDADEPPLGLLQLAHDMVTVGHEDSPLPVSELATALAWRVEMLARTEDFPAHGADVFPVEPVWDAPPEEEEMVPVEEAVFDQRPTLRDLEASLPGLRAEADQTQAAYADLWARVIADCGEHMTRAEPFLAALRARRDEQRPHEVATVNAEQYATECEERAESAERILAATIADEPEPISVADELLRLLPVDAPAGLRERAESLDYCPEVESWRRDVAVARFSAESLRGSADSARGEAAAARAVWVEAAGVGGIVTDGIYRQVELDISDLDLQAMNAARDARDKAKWALERRENTIRLRRLEASGGLSAERRRAADRRLQQRRRVQQSRGRGLS